MHTRIAGCRVDGDLGVHRFEQSNCCVLIQAGKGSLRGSDSTGSKASRGGESVRPSPRMRTPSNLVATLHIYIYIKQATRNTEKNIAHNINNR